MKSNERDWLTGLTKEQEKGIATQTSINDAEAAITAWFENLPWKGARAINKTWQQILDYFNVRFSEKTLEAAKDNLVSRKILIKVLTKNGAKAYMLASHDDPLAMPDIPSVDELPQQAAKVTQTVKETPRKTYSSIRYHRRNWSLRELCASKWNVCGISKTRLDQRLKAKWTIHDALNTPSYGKKPYDPFVD